MGEARWDDNISIINYGLVSQRNIADLNKLASGIIRAREYEGVLDCFKELLAISAETDPEKLLEKESRIDKIREGFCKNRIEILKEAKLLQELRHTNDTYIEKIGTEIAEAQKYCDEQAAAGGSGTLFDLLKRRIYELTTSKVVAENFSSQLKLSEDNAFDMAEKIWNALVTILPLLRGSISIEADKALMIRTGKLIRKKMEEFMTE